MMVTEENAAFAQKLIQAIKAIEEKKQKQKSEYSKRYKTRGKHK